MPIEEWRPVPGLNGYEVSSHGAVRSVDGWFDQRHGAGTVYRRFRKGRVLRSRIDKQGYRSTGAGRTHALVMLAFYGEPPEGMEIAHNDGNKANAYLSNLRYTTKSQNEADKLLHGTHNRGIRHGMAKLTEEDVLMIRTVVGQTHQVLADRYGVSEACIRSILTRKRWGWL
jgi:UDP-N-acetylmuramyl tripeptide synthase